MHKMKTLMTVKAALSAGLVAMILSGCVTDSVGTKTLAGGVVGAGVGGLLGSKLGGGKGQMAAIAAGTLAGALFGKSIGESLDRADRQYAGRAERRAESAPIGQTISWNNPDSGHSGTVTPTRDGINNGTGEYCREYHTEIYVGGKLEDAYGTSCRQPDGTWQIVSAK
jgi:surface antigen